MGKIRDSANATVREYETDNLPASGLKKPVKLDLRNTFGVVEDQVATIEGLATVGVRWLTQTIRVRAIANVDIATSLKGGDVLNGLTLVAGDHVFLPFQTVGATVTDAITGATNSWQNGIYTVPASGAAARAVFADAAAELAYAGFLVSGGNLGAGERWTLPLASAAITLGTTALSFSRIGVDVNAVAEAAAAGRGALYGFTDLVKARLFAEESWEADFTQGYYRKGLAPSSSLASLPGWSFSRNSAATAEPSGSALVAYAAHAPRIINRGLLVESGRVEGIGFTSNFASWTGTNLTLTTSGVDYAGVAFTKVAATAAAAADLMRETTAMGDPAGTTFWCIVKKGTGPTTGNQFAVYNVTTAASLMLISLNYDTGAITYDAGGGATSGASATAMGEDCWLLAMTPPTGVNAGNVLRCRAGFIGAAAAAGAHFFISHAQVENTAFPTSRIQNNTGLQATRLSDVAITSKSEAGDFTVVAVAAMGAHLINEAIFAVADPSGANALVVLRDATGVVTAQSINAGVTTQRTIATKAGARTIRVVLTSLPGSTRISVDGETPVELATPRPRDLSILTLGRESTSGQAFLNGYMRRVMVWSRAATDQQMIDMTRLAGQALSDAPVTGHPLQGRFNPVTGVTPEKDYGRRPVSVYGTLPCALLIGELKGPSALAVAKDGAVLWRDTAHAGRWIDVDATNRRCLVGAADPRTIRWLHPDTGAQLNAWTVPVGTPGDLYGVRITGNKLVANLNQTNNACQVWIWDLDANRYPTGAGTKFTGYEGVGFFARSMLIQTAQNLLWIASLSTPTNAQGCQGAVRAYNLTTGTLVHDLYGHYPNDVDVTPAGEIVWADEHLDRIRAWNPVTLLARSLMAGLKVRHDYEPAVSSINANTLATQTFDGSGLSGAAVEYRGRNGLYAPNGCRAISNDTFAVADTDNGRVVIMRATATWEPEVTAVIGLLNEPTKVAIIPAV